ncbi:hypothetical protein [Paenibacillus polymyxa]|nr:hypothetical protein [Paenibacillus polymyxa]UQQ36162.1 hypothetical protein LMH85_04385 [Paenibacillus polymyxa]
MEQVTLIIDLMLATGNVFGADYYICLGAATGVIIYLIMEIIENKWT